MECVCVESSWPQWLRNLILGILISSILFILTKTQDTVAVYHEPSVYSIDQTQKFQKIDIHNGGK
uniref:p7b n=1 Tax=Maize chlorotic mottle virus TaxID=12138 RepID=A0A2H4TIF3_MCMV|nr:p7b [Maize chlorotic mottle virus]ATY93231.1 p7b [Maize chlorotic mottle virus]ATY93245.1 p7b [Maize chlorotic mottle virus]ATY93252.1 p7b [Maize chlorotic mottle virus]ATY93259.1 p7b [Maize chlorotic mottle virus]